MYWLRIFLFLQASKVLPNMKGLQGGTLFLAHGTADGTHISSIFLLIANKRTSCDVWYWRYVWVSSAGVLFRTELVRDAEH